MIEDVRLTEGGRADRSGALLPWVGLALGVAALTAIVTVTLVTRGQLARLRGQNSDLAARAGALELTNSELLSAQAKLFDRLKLAEKRCADLEVKQAQMAEKQPREATAAKVKDGLKTVLPAGTVERIEKARLEREKNMTPAQKKQAEKTRAAVIDGIAEWMDVQKKVADGKMTKEQARKLMREKWRARMEEFRKMRDAGQKLPEAKEEF